KRPGRAPGGASVVPRVGVVIPDGRILAGADFGFRLARGLARPRHLRAFPPRHGTRSIGLRPSVIARPGSLVAPPLGAIPASPRRPAPLSMTRPERMYLTLSADDLIIVTRAAIDR